MVSQTKRSKAPGGGGVIGISSREFAIIRDTEFPLSAYTLKYRNQYNGKSIDAQISLLSKEILGLLEHVTSAASAVGNNALIEPMHKSRVYCPKDTLDLSKSGTLTTTSAPNGAVSMMSYGAKGRPFYAVTVHEGFARHAEPTKRKFLEAAVTESTQIISDSVIDGFRRLLPK
jgi:hypothetical protein